MEQEKASLLDFACYPVVMHSFDIDPTAKGSFFLFNKHFNQIMLRIMCDEYRFYRLDFLLV